MTKAESIFHHQNLKMIRLVSLSFIIYSLLSGCINLNSYERFYHSYLPKEESKRSKWIEKNNPIFLKEGEEPKVYTVSNIPQALIEYQSAYYTVVGYSGFTGSLASNHQLIEFAKKLRATVVLKTSNYENSSVVGGGGYISDGTGYLDSTYTVHRYNQFAYFLVKVKLKKKPHVGISFDTLREAERKKYETNTGVIVRIVYQNTP
ncbi:MAG: hypothetical protein OXJ52_07430, partial [Oligoflexia bacterium]|nr:hypothetical protein [Oligoflexia bacterium]